MQELKTGLPHSLILGTSQLKVHNIMSGVSRRTSNPPILSWSLLFSVVTSTVWPKEKKEFGVETEKMKAIEASGFLG